MAQPQRKATFYPVATKKPPYTLQVPGVEKKPGEGIPRRHPSSIDGLATTPDPDVKTLYDVVTRGARLFGDAECMGSRKLIKTHVEEKMVKKMVDGEEREVPKQWTYYEMSGYTFMSFKQYKEQVDICASGLRKLGLVAGDRLHIYAATRYAAGLCRFLFTVADEIAPVVANGLPCRMLARRNPSRLSPLMIPLESRA
jgi:long-chain acyl-CoA synthetase